MSLEIIKFFKNYIKAINLSLKTEKNTLAIVQSIIQEDYQQKIKWEVSLKIKKNKIIKTARFLSMDGKSYSYKSEKLFLERLEIYNKIMNKKINNVSKDRAIACLLEFSKTTTGLDFGADIKDNNYLFSFWLIFGVDNRYTDISFLPYNFNKLVEKPFKIISFFKKRRNIVHFGINVNNQNIFYEIYFLFKKETILNNIFTNLIREIKKNFTNYNCFYFFSELYDKNGKCLKKKIFIEFFDKIYTNKQDFPKILEKTLKIVQCEYKLLKLIKTFQIIGGRISLISFELDNTLTFYIRPD
jgi:hypothetical protein